MGKILLHGPATDAAGRWHDAGASLAVNGEGKRNTVSAERALELIAQHRAVAVSPARSPKQGRA